MIGRGMTSAFLFLLVLSPLAVAGQPAPVFRPLITREEVAALEADLMAKVKENQERRCLRPVLRGKPLPGNADADIVAVAQGERFTECFDAVRSDADALRSWLGLRSHDSGPPAAVVEACVGLPEAIGRAVRHEDACSPYLFGRRAVPALVSLLRASKALTMQVRVLADAGKGDEALALALDSLLFFQDLARGPGAPLIAAMLGTAASRVVVEDGLRPVLSGASPALRVLERTALEIDALLASEPGFCDFLPYERYGMALQLFLPVLKGKGWGPPGGFDELGTPQDLPEGGAPFGSPKWNEVALSWLGLDRVHGQMAAACKEAKGPLGMAEAFEELAGELSDRAGRSNWRRMLLVLVSPDPVLAVREWIFDILGGIAVPAFGRYALKYRERTFLLQAVRIHVEILTMRLKTGKCPSQADLGSGLWTGFLADRTSGEPLQVSTATDGSLSVRPSPAFAAALGLDADPLAYSFECR